MAALFLFTSVKVIARLNVTGWRRKHFLAIMHEASGKKEYFGRGRWVVGNLGVLCDCYGIDDSGILLDCI